jgi:DNA-binding response OmpR family regulator
VASEVRFVRILVVEDNARLNELVMKKLKSEKYSVDACLRGDDALDYTACAEYDAIILDIMLPGLGGLEVLKAMRSKNNKSLSRYFFTSILELREQTKRVEKGWFPQNPKRGFKQ